MIPLAVSTDNFGNILLICFQILLATGIMLCNLLVFVAIVSSNSFRKEYRFVYMLSTCISDFCTGITWYYIGVFDVREDIPRKNDTRFIASNFVGISYLTILAAQADRYCAVSFPMGYIKRMTYRKTIGILILLWAYSFAFLISRNLTPSGTALKITAIGMLVWTVITYIVMVGLNFKLFLIAKYQNSRVPNAERDQNRSSLYMIIGVAASFILLWAPIFIKSLVCSFTYISWCAPTNNLCTNAVAVLPRINCVLTPLLYIRGCSSVKKTIYQMFYGCCCRICMKIDGNSVGHVQNETVFVLSR